MKLLVIVLVCISSVFAANEECLLNYDTQLDIKRSISERIYPVNTYSEDRDIILETYYSYSRETRKLMNYIVSDLQGADTYSPVELMFYLDDFKADETKDGLIVIDYGVGGGNGGLVFLSPAFKVVADYFDGDLLYCSPKYRL